MNWRRPVRRRVPRRAWSIRARILTLLMLPLVPLLAMWLFTTGVTLGPALNLYDAYTSVTAAGQPTSALVTELQAERKLSIVNVATGVAGTGVGALAAQRTHTDDAVAKLFQSTSSEAFRSSASSLTRGYLSVLQKALDGLGQERVDVDKGGASEDSVMDYYNGAIDNAFGLYGTIAGIDDHNLARQANTVIALSQADEMFAREDAIVAGAIAADHLEPSDYPTLIGTIATQRFLYQQATRYLNATDQATYQNMLSGAAFERLRLAEATLTARPPGDTLPVGFTASEWDSDADTVRSQLTALENTEENRTIAATKPAAVAVILRLVIAGLVGFLILVALVVVAIRIARGLIARVNTLREDALEVARHRLPSVVARLRRGETVDVDAEAPSLAYGGDELSQLGDAFVRVQRTAIASAVQEARLRHGLNQVFLNIARRSQTLLHRQLALLDAMERRTTDPDDLEELFRVDHLATRMRRHAEDLVILAGATPGRGWRHPVSFTDVLRAAASEVEQYARIVVRPLPELALAGRAVGDVVHLVAELLENATLFSPPETQVSVTAQLVPHGFAIEIEDRGLGMTPDAIDEANARIADPPDFDPANSTRLGLFVVAQLAAKHEIRVTLRSSAYGGVTAVVLIPVEYVVTAEDVTALAVGSGGRHADARGTVRMLTAGPPEPAVIVGDAIDATGPVDDGYDPFETVFEPVAPPILTLVTPPPEVPPLNPDGLPQRVRKTGHPAADADSGPIIPTDRDPDVTTGGVSRTAERMRTMLTSFQDGMRLGRRDAHTQGADDGSPDAGSGEASTLLPLVTAQPAAVSGDTEPSGVGPAAPDGETRPAAGATAPDGEATPPEAVAAPGVAPATATPAVAPTTNGASKAPDTDGERPRAYVRRHERPHR